MNVAQATWHDDTGNDLWTPLADMLTMRHYNGGTIWEDLEGDIDTHRSGFEITEAAYTVDACYRPRPGL